MEKKEKMKCERLQCVVDVAATPAKFFSALNVCVIKVRLILLLNNPYIAPAALLATLYTSGHLLSKKIRYNFMLKRILRFEIIPAYCIR